MNGLDYLSIVSNEVISSIISLLDAPSFFRFCGCSRALNEFRHPTNEQWRIFYSIQWHISDRELQCYEEKDWCALFRDRFSNERLYATQVSEKHAASPNRPARITLLEECLSILSNVSVNDLGFVVRVKPDPYVHLQQTRFDIAVSGIAKILRTNRDFLQLDLYKRKLLDYLTALEADIKKRQALRFGLVSLLADAIAAKPEPFTLKMVFSLLNQYLQSRLEKGSHIREWRAIVDNLGLLHSAFEAFEQNSDLNLQSYLLNTVRLCLKKQRNGSEQLIRRPEFMKKLKQIAPEQNSQQHFVIAVISSIAQVDPEYAVSQSLFELVVDALYKNNDPYDRLLFYMIQALIHFTKSETLRISIAKNSVLLNHLLSFLHRQRNNQGEDSLGITIAFFHSLARKSKCLPLIFHDFYLDQLLQYIETIDYQHVFSDMCDLMGYYLRYGIETLQLESVHKKIEPYLGGIIEHEFFKESIPFWQNYYCGMQMPREITRSLVERILPELPQEYDIDYSRSCHVELLANIVQIDPEVFVGLDIQLAFEHLAVKLILDEDRNDDSHRGQIPYPLSFLSAAVTLPQALELAINNAALLDKMHSLYNEDEENETMYMATVFFSHLVTREGWDNSRGLELLARFGATMPVDAQMYFLFTFIEPYDYLFAQSNPVEMHLFGSWIIARMAQTKEGRLGLQKLSSDVIEWLSGHSDMRIRKNMNYYRNCVETAKKAYDI